jgi:nicotinate phosphoribosyltransferase
MVAIANCRCEQDSRQLRYSAKLAVCAALANLKVTDEETVWLKKNCTYLPDEYLDYLKNFRFYPDKQVQLEWLNDTQDISIIMKGRWIDTILYEIPLLALVSEAYFRFVDTDWDYVGQYGKPRPHEEG